MHRRSPCSISFASLVAAVLGACAPETGPPPTPGAAEQVPAVGPDGKPIGPAQPQHNPTSGTLVGPPVPDGLQREGQDGRHHLEIYLDEESRAFSQRDRVLDTLRGQGLGDSQVIADVGAGSGYFTWPLSAVVGASGRVVAVDIDPEAVAFLKERATREPLAHDNLEVVLSQPDDVTLPAGSLDWALMVQAHFYLPTPDGTVDPAAIACLRSLHEALKPDGRLAVIEFRDDPSRGAVVPLTDILRPFEEVGFVVQSEYDWLEREYFVVLGKAASSSAGDAG